MPALVPWLASKPSLQLGWQWLMVLTLVAASAQFLALLLLLAAGRSHKRAVSKAEAGHRASQGPGMPDELRVPLIRSWHGAEGA